MVPVQEAHLASISSLKSPFSRLNFVIIELPLEIEKQQIIQILLFSSGHLITFLASLPQRLQIDIIRFAHYTELALNLLHGTDSELFCACLPSGRSVPCLVPLLFRVSFKKLFLLQL